MYADIQIFFIGLVVVMALAMFFSRSRGTARPGRGRSGSHDGYVHHDGFFLQSHDTSTHTNGAHDPGCGHIGCEQGGTDFGGCDFGGGDSGGGDCGGGGDGGGGD